MVPMQTLDQYMGRKESLVEKVKRVTGFTPTSLQERAISLVESTDKSILVVAPTGSGKTLIGYAGLIYYGKGFYLAPLISLMNEKYNELTRIMKRLGRTVIMTNKDYRIPLRTVLGADVKIMSPYKFLLYQNFLSPSRHGRLVVVDEIHKISGDPLFEAAVTLALDMGFRIIGLSATLTDKDAEKLAEWLGAELVRGDVRPVKLEYRPVKLDYTFNQALITSSTIKVNGYPIVGVFSTREEAAAYIAATIYRLTGKPVIVWAPTRRRVEEIARHIADRLPEDKDLEVIFSDLSSNPSDSVLRITARHGVFIHHGGLSYRARKLVEKVYRERGGVLVTAYTLSHGVNLPGTYLVLSTIHDYKGEPLDSSTFHQIVGRAGRPGYDKIGIVVSVLVGENEYRYYTMLVSEKASELIPAFLSDAYAVIRLLLPVYARTRSWESVVKLAKKSFSYSVLGNADTLLNSMLSVLKMAIRFYESEAKIGARVAMSMGLAPVEYKAITAALNAGTYKEAVRSVIEYSCQLHGVDPSTVEPEVMEYGYLAAWHGTPSARVVADTVQNLLETGAFWASRVFGWGSKEHNKLVLYAKKFTYAGNERLEPLAKRVRIEVLRRLVKAVPHLLGDPVSHGEALGLVLDGVREIYRYRKRVSKKHVAAVVEDLFYALTGDKPSTRERDLLVTRAVETLKREKIEVV